LEAWKSGDYPTSFDYLHQYFDYTMQNRDRLTYQYALMNLAVLHCEFGAFQESLAAMLETVSTARENRDVNCLNFALSWLHHFGKAHPELVSDLDSSLMLGTGKESIEFLKFKAKESNNLPLWCSALLSEAKLGLSNGESVATAHELLVRSSHIMVEHNMKSYLGAQMAMHTALWDRLGISYLGQSYCDVFLHCYSKHSMFDDELKLVCRLSSFFALQGRYNEAFKLLDSFDKAALTSWRPQQYWHEWRGLLQLRRDLHRNDLDAAAHLLSQLRQTQPDDLEPDLSFVIETLHIEYLVRRNELPAAFEHVESLLKETRAHNRDISIRIRLLLLKAQLFDKAGRPQKGFTISMQAASMAWRARVMPALWQAIGSLANILNSLGEFDAAARLLDAVIPRYLECGSAFIAGQLYSVMADAYVGMAGSASSAGSTSDNSAEARPGRRREYLVKAHGMLDQALTYFAAVDDVEKQCETLAKKGTILKVAGDAVLANDCAAKYMVLRRQGATAVS
jgi:anaphase-promoting complex subunit 5